MVLSVFQQVFLSHHKMSCTRIMLIWEPSFLAKRYSIPLPFLQSTCHCQSLRLSNLGSNRISWKAESPGFSVLFNPLALFSKTMTNSPLAPLHPPLTAWDDGARRLRHGELSTRSPVTGADFSDPKSGPLQPASWMRISVGSTTLRPSWKTTQHGLSRPCSR